MLGYWTPRHLSERLKEFERAGFKNYLIVASEELLCSRETLSSLPPTVLICKKSLHAKELRIKIENTIPAK
jgi:predicted nuclease of restriction endonuclease-like RecB superfamily